SANLSPWLNLQGGDVQRFLYYISIHERLILGENEKSAELFTRFGDARALLLPNGRYLLNPSIFDNDLPFAQRFINADIHKLIIEAERDPRLTSSIIKIFRAVIHENVEKLTQIIRNRDENRHRSMKELILAQPNALSSYTELIGEKAANLISSGDLLFNDIIANAFELIFLKENGVLADGDLSERERAFLEAIEPVLRSNRSDYFRAEFWDASEMYRALSNTLHRGRLYEIAAATDKEIREIKARKSLTIDEKMDGAIRESDFVIPGTFDEMLAAYYGLKVLLVVAADKEDGESFRQVYKSLLKLLPALDARMRRASGDDVYKTLGIIAESANMPQYIVGDLILSDDKDTAVKSIRREISGLACRKFSPKFTRLIEDICGEVTAELYDDEQERSSKRKELLKNIKPYNLAYFIPIDVLIDDYLVHKEDVKGLSVSLTRALSAYASKVIGKDVIFAHEMDDELFFRATLKHEILHYLMDQGQVRAPPEAESLTFCVQMLEYVISGGKSVEENEKLLFECPHIGLKLLPELYKRGKELGESGDAGFRVLPGVSDGAAGYISLKGLLLEARIIFKDNGMDSAILDDAYRAQIAIAAILTGQIMGMREKDPGFRSLKFLRDFFGALYERLAPPDKEFLSWIDTSLLPELKEYASYLLGQRITFKKKTHGLWEYFRTSELSGEIHYLITDLYPRETDATGRDDIEGKKRSVRERAYAQLL
ncbi:MAG: hypothetical protein LHV69_11905, partial [Elusimicrobia bacterium]|nr:hypothetical protein [Candidatus Obscuribacterium magneticum]